MLIKGIEIDDKLVVELGRFTVLWNCFERFQCNNLCKPSVIKSIATKIKIDQEKQATLANVLNTRRGWFGQIIFDYVETALHPGNAQSSSHGDKELMCDFLDQKGADLTAGCLLVIYRIRNNLMHGLKIVEDLNDQYELFQAVNNVLESIEEA